MARRAAFITLVAMIVVAAMWGLGGTRHASSQEADPWTFSSYSANCSSAQFATNLGYSAANLQVQVRDSANNLIGSSPVTFGYSISGTITYSATPVGSVTLQLWAELDGWLLRDQVSVTLNCSGSAAAAVAAGCDLGMVPTGSVVGQFNWNAEAYWKPGELTANPLVTLPAGKTAWVIGTDAAQKYYKIVWSCNYLWVRAETMGPNPDKLWSNTPLPMRTVE